MTQYVSKTVSWSTNPLRAPPLLSYSVTQSLSHFVSEVGSLPELPEVETIRCDLEKSVQGKILQAVQLFYNGFVKYPSPDIFISSLAGKKIIGTGRRGKYLFLHLSDNLKLVIHFRMTGRIIYSTVKTVPIKHTHGIFLFKDGGELHFNDVRKFGAMWLVDDTEASLIAGLKSLGPEPLAEEFTVKFLTDICQKSRSKIKSFLLSQKNVAGLGNIYVDEALFRAGLDPHRQTNELAAREIKILWQGIKEVLEEGIKARGTTVSDYVDVQGKTGSFQKSLQVYGRAGQNCFICGSSVQRKKTAGRSSYFCPLCQKSVDS